MQQHHVEISLEIVTISKGSDLREIVSLICF